MAYTCSYSIFVVGGEGTCVGKEPWTVSETEDGTQAHCMHGTGHCKWFNVRMGFGFISMTSRGGHPVDPPMDVFVHQVSCCCVSTQATITPVLRDQHGSW